MRIGRPTGAVALALTPLNATAQKADADLAKAAQNPVAAVISLPLQENVLFGAGPHGDPARHFVARRPRPEALQTPVSPRRAGRPRRASLPPGRYRPRSYPRSRSRSWPRSARLRPALISRRRSCRLSAACSPGSRPSRASMASSLAAIVPRSGRSPTRNSCSCRWPRRRPSWRSPAWFSPSPGYARRRRSSRCCRPAPDCRRPTRRPRDARRPRSSCRGCHRRLGRDGRIAHPG